MRGISIPALKSDQFIKLAEVIPEVSVPEDGSRIEVFFTQGAKGWYRGTFTKEGSHDVIFFDDGDEQIIDNWSCLKWRTATNKRKNKSKIK